MRRIAAHGRRGRASVDFLDAVGQFVLVVGALRERFGRQLAKLGYVAFALDMYGAGQSTTEA